MRTIKLRFWCKNDKKMYVPDELFFDSDTNTITGTDDYASDGSVHTDKCTVIMEYTGLKDKNGVEIYEGDIVKAKAHGEYSESSCIGKIIYSDGVAYQVVDKGNSCGLSLAWGGWESFEIIGNIYQNPELLN